VNTAQKDVANDVTMGVCSPISFSKTWGVGGFP